MARGHNPITIKILSMVSSGKITYEKICVATDLKYPTLMNLFKRPTISKMLMKSLLYAKVISERDRQDYIDWCIKNNIDPNRPGLYKLNKNRLGLYDPPEPQATDQVSSEAADQNAPNGSGEDPSA